ncbi:hypothetical protein PACTADRAFT_82007 [Pachysolen tannophilus NRRL Y-2460]|uniref:Uncharacterized protein n=1 Tax=Pachysolen tannophilus NRRL Y-2460 TaxID=669874 RepID=A0A1E4TRP6_PACTA|nr:hypothetical protein PACTADRAFT_82007 [Pachysolen tannophilus NRRL Y-2460]
MFLFAFGVAVLIVSEVWAYPINNNITSDVITISKNDNIFNYNGFTYIQETNEVCGKETFAFNISELIDKESLLSALGNETFMEADADFLSSIDTKYCVRLLNKPQKIVKTDLSAPISLCLNSEFGDGGSIGKSVSVSVSVGGDLSFSMHESAMQAITMTWSISASISKAFKLVYSCTAPAGEVAQLWATPVGGEVDFETRKYYQLRHGGKRHFVSDWTKVKNYHFPVNEFSPRLACKSGPATNCELPQTTNFVFKNSIEN